MPKTTNEKYEKLIIYVALSESNELIIEICAYDAPVRWSSQRVDGPNKQTNERTDGQTALAYRWTLIMRR